VVSDYRRAVNPHPGKVLSGSLTFVLPDQQTETSRVANRLGHREQFEEAGMETARPRLLYTSRRGRRSKW